MSEITPFAIETSEAEKWHELLTAVLGMGFERASGATFYRLDEWHHRIAVYESETEAVKAVGWQLEDESALDVMVALLQDAGVALVPPPAELRGLILPVAGGRAVFVDDDAPAPP